MKITLGLKAHSGWAALVTLGARSGETTVVDRRRIELIAGGGMEWAKQPYHAAEKMPREEGRRLVRKGIEAARAGAEREVRAAVDRYRVEGHEVAACAVLMGEPMPGWSVDEILSVHFRMHKAEGTLFRDALLRAAQACGVEALALREKEMAALAATRLSSTSAALLKRIAALGKSVGPPWGKDQKDAALAALIALEGR